MQTGVDLSVHWESMLHCPQVCLELQTGLPESVQCPLEVHSTQVREAVSKIGVLPPQSEA